MIPYKNQTQVFYQSVHHLEGSPLWLTPRTYRVSYIIKGVRMRLGLASLAYVDMALLNSNSTEVNLVSLAYVDMASEY